MNRFRNRSTSSLSTARVELALANYDIETDRVRPWRGGSILQLEPWTILSSTWLVVLPMMMTDSTDGLLGRLITWGVDSILSWRSEVYQAGADSGGTR